MRKFFKTSLFKSLMIMLTTAFDVEFEVTDEFLLELENEVKAKCPKKSRRLC